MITFNLTDNSQRRSITRCMQTLVGLRNLVSVEGIIGDTFDRQPWGYPLLEEIQAMLPTLRKVFLSSWHGECRVWVLETPLRPQETQWSEHRLPYFTRWQIVTDWYADIHRRACLV